MRRAAVLLPLILVLALIGPAPPTGAVGAVIPAAGTATDGIDAASVTGAQALPGGGWAVPVRAAKPGWLADGLLLESQTKGQAPAPAQAIADLPASGYVGIRPGSEMIAPYGCTMNFVFGSPGSYSIGTAGHCVDSVGDPVTLLTVAPGTDNPVLVTIGNAIKRVESGIGKDFALVSIRPELQSWVFTTIPQVLGPCGSYTGDGLTDQPSLLKGGATLDAGEQIFHYGHGLGIGTGGTARTGHALYWESTAFWWAGPVVFGDSGSAARVGTTSLAAAGDVTHLVVDTRHLGATAAGTRITEMIRIAGQPLANSPYC
jgi:hypothetical protein